MGGGTMIESKGGSIVWVRRKNGTWWPGKILCSTKNSSSSRFPVKLLGRHNASVSWYNVEKSTRVKAFRCGEFDDCIKKAESSKVAFAYPKRVKYVHREDAILHALDLEKQEQDKLKRPVVIAGLKESETHGECIRAKRSKCAYSSIDSISFLENSAHSSKMISTFTHAGENSSSKSTSSLKSDSKSSHRKKETTTGRDALRPKKTSFKVTSRPAVNKWKHKGKLHKQHFRGRSVVSTNGSSTEIGPKGKPVLVSCQSWAVNQLSRPSPANTSEVTTRKNRMTLTDVHITVQGTYRGEHSPLVSLMSGLNQKAVIGHPINIEVVDDSSEILIKKESSDQKKRTRMLPLVWRTSKRTPVCYTACRSSSATKAGKVKQGSKNMSNKKPRTRCLANGLRCKQEAGDISTVKNAAKSGLYHGNDSVPCVTCVPVKNVFIKLIEALKEA